MTLQSVYGGAGSGGGAGVAISTTEVQTTSTYLGKPVFVKAVDVGSLLNNGVKSVNHGISGTIDVLLDIAGAVSNGLDVHLPLPFVSTNLAAQISVTVPNTTQVNVGTGQDRTAFSGHVVLAYTKV